MGVYTRPDSPYWWLHLETTKERERTEFPVGTTTAQRRDSRRLAEALYHQRMNAVAARLYRLPSAQPAIRFAKYAETYLTNVISHRKGAQREGEILLLLVAFFGEDLLTSIDQDRVRAYYTARRQTVTPATAHHAPAHRQMVTANTVNREVDLLKTMLRDAAPKYLPVSPIVGMKRLKIIKPKRRLLKTEEETQLLAAGDPQDRAILILGIDTLARLGDLLELQRVDREGVWLYIRDPKSGEPYKVALSPRAVEAVDAIPGEDRYIFSKFRRAEKPRDWPGSVRQRLEWLCAQTGVPYGKAKGGVTFHWATRRTGATRLLIEKRTALPVVQRQGNWKNPDVLLEIYAEAQDADLLKAVGQKPFTSRSRKKRKTA
jgi:integrase